MTSGAIQNGVPTNVLFLFRVFVSCPATPKSANLTSPFSDNKTLAAMEETNTVSQLGITTASPLSSSAFVFRTSVLVNEITNMSLWFNINTNIY